jgi:hypothetical protein
MTHRAAFVRGLRHRSLLVPVLAFALVALSLAGLELMARDGTITRLPEGRWVRYGNDDTGHLTYLLARLRESPPTGTTVYLLGGSGTMECFLDQESLSADVSRAAGQDVSVVSLAGHQQSFADSLALVDNLPNGRALLAIGLAPMRFTNSPQDDAGLLNGDPFLVSSPDVRTVLEKEHVTATVPFGSVLPGLIRYAVGYVQERWRIHKPLFADIGYNPHYTINGPLRSWSYKLSMARRDLAFDTAHYAAYADYNFAMLEELVQVAHRRGFDVVFFDQPLNGHVLGSTWGGIVPSYRQRAHVLAARLGVPYLTVAQRVELQNRDFLDVYHLVVRGRLKWQPVLSAQIGAVLKEDDSVIATNWYDRARGAAASAWHEQELTATHRN